MTFTLIIIRVGLGYTLDSATGGGPGGKLSYSTDQRGGMTSGMMSGGPGEYPLRPVAINVTVAREHDGIHGGSLEDGGESFDTKQPVEDLETGQAK